MVERRTLASLFRLAALSAAIPASLAGQTIALRTVPVATGDQFLVHPSRNLAMGTVSIALDGPWLDPFLNPALGSLLDESAFLASPTFYGIEGDNGAGRTVPLSGLFSGRRWFGGVAVAFQQIVDENGSPAWIVRPGPWLDLRQPRRLDAADATNSYASGFLGLRLSARWSLGAGASVAKLNAVDGVDLLYAGSQFIDQDGKIWDVRAGLVGDLGEERRLEAAVVHHRFSMNHDVGYLEWVWDPETMQGQVIERIEENLDRTRTTGLHLVFTAPVGERWRAGPTFTVNRKSHPKIPNYDLLNVPRGPGDSWAFNMGVGLGHQRGPLRFGVDVIYEPVWSETWAEAADTVRTTGGTLLQPGDRTVENDFFLSNLHLRLGIGRETERWGFQFGLGASSHETQLEQWNVVEAERREQDESWMEWTHSFGAVLKFPDAEVRYAGRMTTGTGRPSVDFAFREGTDRANAALAAADFLIAPSGPLILQEARVITHQLTVRLPLR